MKITKIYHPEEQNHEETEGFLRVAAYCRVSTKSDEQLSSYETQVAVYRQRISDEPGWTFAGIYADRGISGVQAKKRPEFLRMIRDCEAGLIDCVICKSISRFARNTVDALKYIRLLQGLGIRLIIEKEGIDTASEYSEMMLSVLAAFAQEELHSHSENVKWGKRKRLQNGQALLIPCYGYVKNATGGNYDIVPEEAEAVRLIFNLYEHGVSVPEITRILEQRGYPTPDGEHKIWDESRIHYMIQNEKYAGDIITQKFYKKSYMDYRTYRNDGVLPSKYLRNHHEPLVFRQQFERCNLILELKKKSTPSQYPFANYLRCPYCGHVLRRRRFEIQNCDTHFCCEGKGACRSFAIMAIPVKQAILSAYADLDMEQVGRIAGYKRKRQAAAAQLLLDIKEEHPAFEAIDYWWLDDLVKSISFGQHSQTASSLKQGGTDDRTITVTWRCGIVTTLPSGVVRDSHDPRHKAKLWNAYILRYPERYPELAKQIRK